MENSLVGLKLFLNKNFNGWNLTERSPSSALGLNQLIAGVNIGPSSLVQIGLRSQLTDKEVWLVQKPTSHFAHTSQPSILLSFPAVVTLNSSKF